MDGCRAGVITCMSRGAFRQVLKLPAAWEGSSGKSAAANPPEADKTDHLSPPIPYLPLLKSVAELLNFGLFDHIFRSRD